MVKINLLKERVAEQPVPSTARVPVEPKPIQAILVAAVLVVAVIAGVAWYWYKTYTTLEEKQAEAKKLESEEIRLRNVQQEVENYQKKIAELKRRTSVIEQLKQSQTGPVQMMNAIALSLPTTNSQVWLESLSQKPAMDSEVIHLVGYGYDVNAIADFYSKLKGENYFTEIEWLYYDKTKSPVKFEFECKRLLKNPNEKEAKNG